MGENNNVDRKAGQQITPADGLQPPLISGVEAVEKAIFQKLAGNKIKYLRVEKLPKLDFFYRLVRQYKAINIKWNERRIEKRVKGTE